MEKDTVLKLVKPAGRGKKLNLLFLRQL